MIIIDAPVYQPALVWLYQEPIQVPVFFAYDEALLPFAVEIALHYPAEPFPDYQAGVVGFEENEIFPRARSGVRTRGRLTPFRLFY